MDLTPKLTLSKTGPSDLRYGCCCLGCDLVIPENQPRDGGEWRMVCQCPEIRQRPDWRTGPKYWD